MKTTFQWEPNSRGDMHGTATFHFMGGSIKVPMESFKQAFELSEAIDLERQNVRREARVAILREIGIKVQP